MEQVINSPETALLLQVCASSKGRALYRIFLREASLKVPKPTCHYFAGSIDPLYLEVSINNIKALGVLGQLDPDVSTAHKNGLQSLPLLLDVQPGVKYHVHCAQLPLPVCHNLQELGVALYTTPCQSYCT